MGSWGEMGFHGCGVVQVHTARRRLQSWVKTVFIRATRCLSTAGSVFISGLALMVVRFPVRPKRCDPAGLYPLQGSFSGMIAGIRWRPLPARRSAFQSDDYFAMAAIRNGPSIVLTTRGQDCRHCPEQGSSGITVRLLPRWRDLMSWLQSASNYGVPKQRSESLAPAANAVPAPRP